MVIIVMKGKILTLLKENQSFLSGQQLCEQLGVSRTAVWKVMKQLKDEGYEITSIPNKGYCLKSVPNILSKNEIKSQLNTTWLGQNCIYYEEIDSTNLQGKIEAEKGATHGTLLVADSQTKGRGRKGRVWESPPGGNLYFSLILRPQFEVEKASMLTILMAIAVSRGIKFIGGNNVLIKWPNDLVIKEKKVAGILTEMSAEMGAIHYVVVGAGINVGAREYSIETNKYSTCLEEEVEGSLLRANLLGAILEQFELLYEQFCIVKDLSFIKEEYEECLVNKGKEVIVLDAKGEYEAIAQGISDLGELVVIDKEKNIHLVYAGEVSVRGIYGYV